MQCLKSRCYANNRLEWLDKKVSYGCETPRNSDIRLVVCHRWLWPRAPPLSRNLPRDHTRIRRPAPSLLDTPRLPAISGSCRLPFHGRTARNIDCEREPSTNSAVRMGENAAGGVADIRCCDNSVPAFSRAREAIGICEPDASRSRTCHHYCHLYRLCFLDSLGHLERLCPTNNQARPQFLRKLGDCTQNPFCRVNR